MIRSMTGYARSVAETPFGQLVWELRSVNHRYLELQLRLPEAFRPLEGEIRKRAAEHLGRGRVEAALTLRETAEQAPAMELNQELVRTLIGHAREIGRQMPESALINPLDVMRWPGVLVERQPDSEALGERITDSFSAALEQLAAARAREGERLAALLRQRGEEIAALIGEVGERLPAVHEAIRQRLMERITALGVPPDTERLEQELAIIAQKMDVSEELERLGSHLAELLNCLDATGPVGRRLDFLVQEFNREANTLASKSADSETTARAVDLKVLIEQMREQIQNIE